MECTCCKQERSEDEFPLNGDKKGGRRKQCKECMRQINKQWREKNQERVTVYNKTRRNKGKQEATPPPPPPQT